jgi:enoyl-CoA hydratase
MRRPPSGGWTEDATAAKHFKLEILRLETLPAGPKIAAMLLVEPQDGWCRLVLNRPEARNALNTALLGRLAEELGRLAEDEGCNAVVLAGAGGHFAAGADIGEIEGKGSAEAAVDPRKAYWAAIRAFPKPLVAAVDGFCLGGGLELALMADCLVVGATARLGLPETNLGIIPGAGGAQRLAALAGRARAMRMVLLGEIVDAATAEAWGIAGWRAEGDAGPEAEALVARLAGRAPLAVRAAKAAVLQAAEGALDPAAERAAFEALLDTEDKAEGIRAFREKRRPDWAGR